MRLLRFLRLLRDVLLVFLFPDSCIACGAALAAGRRHLCSSCESELRARPGSLALPKSADAQEHTTAELELFYALEFKGVARTVIHALKYRGRTSIAADLARLAAPAVVSACVTPPDVVVPVPLHKIRLRERGFNQSELLAVHLAASVGAPVRRALVRTRHTPPQARLPRQQRLTLARGTFRAAEGNAKLGRVLLVDDVATTGATLAAASQELLRAGADEVVCFAVAGTALGAPSGGTDLAGTTPPARRRKRLTGPGATTKLSCLRARSHVCPECSTNRR